MHIDKIKVSFFPINLINNNIELMQIDVDVKEKTIALP